MIREAQREPVEILSHGKPAAILISAHEYARLKPGIVVSLALTWCPETRLQPGTSEGHMACLVGML